MKRHTLLLLVLVMPLTLLVAQQPTEKLPALDPVNMDLSVEPCTDFYRYANGTWLKRNPIPPEFSRWGSFQILAEKNTVVLREILEEAARSSAAAKGTNGQKIGDFYYTGMDSSTIESLGWKPIEGDLKQIASIKDVTGVQEELAWFHLNGIGGVFGLFANQDQKKSTQVVAHLGQGGLGLPDRDYYVSDDPKLKQNREEYVAHITAMFTLLGDDEADARIAATNVLAFETRLAKASFTRVERRDPITR
jgi:putative endopeptidase